MRGFFRACRGATVLMASTLGAGIFALPYVFERAGLLVGIFYLLIFSAVVIYVHVLYWRTLSAVKEKERLLGLTKIYLGKFGYALGFAAVVCGLMLVLVIHLILGAKFLGLFLPLGWAGGLVFFWLLGTLPLLFKEKRVIWLETLAVVFVVAIILFIFLSAQPTRSLATLSPINFGNLFLPFGVVLFSLAGWTAIEPLYETFKAEGRSFERTSLWSIALGTAFVAVLYFIFVLAILASTPVASPDTISGISGWPYLQTALIGILGFFALWVSYLPIALEIKHALVYDLRSQKKLSLLLVIFVPILLVIFGLNNFFKVIGLAGGVFLGLEYLLIVLIGKSVLRPAGLENFILNLLALVFTAAAVYEIYYFVIG